MQSIGDSDDFIRYIIKSVIGKKYLKWEIYKLRKQIDNNEYNI